MKISIITVSFNNESTIKDTILSVNSQSFQNIEHIFIDGKSKDETVRLIQKFSKPGSKIISEPDNGIYDAMNKGIHQATGDVIGFLNADDVFFNEQSLQIIADEFTRTGTDSVYGNLIYMDSNLQKIIRFWKSQKFQKGLFLKGWMPAHPTFYVKKSVYDKWGGFDLNYRFAADFEITMRFLESKNISSSFIPKVLVKMRLGGVSNNKISNILKSNLESYRACKKNNLNPGIFFIPKKIFSRIPQFFKKS